MSITLYINGELFSNLKYGETKWKYFLDLLENPDYCEQSLLKNELEIVVDIDPDIERLKEVRRNKSHSSVINILIRLEPEIVLPYQFKKKYWKYFDFIICRYVKCDSSKFYYWHTGYIDTDMMQAAKQYHEVLTDKPETEFALLNQNKFSWIRHSNYRLRREILNRLIIEKKSILVGGKNWDLGFLLQLQAQLRLLVASLGVIAKIDLRNFTLPIKKQKLEKIYVGEIKDGLQFLSKTRFSIVIENQSNYVSEKLFQAIAANSVPIYVGPKLSNQDIPENVAIQIEESEVKNLSEVLNSINSNQLDLIRKNGYEWLVNTEESSPWYINSSIRNLTDLIVSIVKKT